MPKLNIVTLDLEALEDMINMFDVLDAKTLHPRGKVRTQGKLIKHVRNNDEGKLNHVAWRRAAMGKPMSTLDEGMLDA
jgi:hypothetical protein